MFKRVAALFGRRNRRNARGAFGLGTTTPDYAWDFVNNKARFAGVDKGALANTPGWSFTRASTGYAQTSAGVLVPFASGELRRTDKGVLIEGARTNLCLYSTLEGGTLVPTGWTTQANTGTARGPVASTTGAVGAWECTATTGEREFFAQTVALAANTTYTVSVYVEAITGTSRVLAYGTSLPAGATSGNITNPSTPGLYTFQITTAGTAGNATLRLGIDTGGDLTALNCTVRFSRIQIEAGAFPSSYIPTTTASATRAADVLSVALPTYNTNLCLQSQTFDNASWAKSRGAITADQVAAPDGTTTADKVGDDTGGGALGAAYVTQSFTVATSTAHTFSVYAKAGGANYLILRPTNFTTPANDETYFNLSAGSIVSTGTGHTATILALANGWYRCSVTFTTDASDTTGDVRIYPSADGVSSTVNYDGASYVYLWGAQLETGSTAGAYIPTTTVAVTAAPLNYPLSLYAEFERAVDTGALEAVFDISTGATAQEAYIDTSSSDTGQVVVNTTGNVMNATAGTMTVGATNKVAARIALNTGIVCANGTLSAQDTTLDPPATPTTLTFGQRVNNASPFFGYLRRAAIYSRALTDAELQAVTR